MGRGAPLTYSYFRGFAAPKDGTAAEGFVVAYDDKADAFFMANKTDVLQTRMTRTIFARQPKWSLEVCHEGESCAKGANCSKLHVKNGCLLPLVVHNKDKPMLISVQNGTNTHLAPSQMQETAGLMFVSTLIEEGIVSEVYPWVCARFMKGACPYGVKCLSLHVSPDLVKNIERPPNEASTTLSQALSQSIPTTPGLQSFIDSTLIRIGFRTIGDMAGISNTVFDAMMHRDIEAAPHHRTFWLLLLQQRTITRTMPLTLALMQFPGIDLRTMDKIQAMHSLNTVGDLLAVRPKVLYSLPLRAQLLDACERLRARFEDDREVYSQINLLELAPNAFFRRMTNLVCEFREKHAHKSWRKQDATRPIVTSLITYVDPGECTCSLDLGTDTVSHSPSGAVNTPCKKLLERVPSLEHWCQCPRQYQLAVNYELSTPSGSRCSEQNALGAIASMGLPTCCIREVFVHGGVHNSEDPNPLFPCGVCENMFRRVSKDVQKQHGGDVMLYMFDQETNPRKLVSIPVSEISHREGSSFRRFIAEDVRGAEDGSAGMLTPQVSFQDPAAFMLPAQPALPPPMRKSP